MKNLTIGKKFSFACAVLVLLVVVLGGVFAYSISSINTNLQAVVTDSLPGVYRISAVEATMYQIRGNFWKHVANDDPAVKAQCEQKIEALKSQVLSSLTEYEKTITTAEDRQQYDKIKPGFEQWFASWAPVAELSRAGKRQEAAAKYFGQSDPVFLPLEASVKGLVEWNKTTGDKNAEVASGTVTRSRLWAWTLLASSIVIGTLLAFIITRSVNTVLTRAITELSEGSEQVAAAAGQVSASSQSLAQGSSEQAASLEETSASSEEINSMARKNTENSRSAADLVASSQRKFTETNHALEQTVLAMGEINAQSGKISKIIKTIDEIAFQTNILALNAAVEAARAGEAGMGFAVVADEVRNLAQRCAQAAKDTSALIEESIAKSDDGKTKVDQVASAIQALTTEASTIKTLVDEVSLGSQEQARGIDQIVKAITQMEQVTQKTAANSEESASAAEELTAQSETLKEVVSRLAALVGAQSTIAAPRRGSVLGASAETRRQKQSSWGYTVPNSSIGKEIREPAADKGAKTPFPMEEEFKEF